MSRDGTDINRRKYVKGIAGTAGIGALAGCSGDEGSTTGDESGDGGSDSGSGSMENADLSGVTINYWDQHNVNSEPVRNGMESKVQEFEEDVGADMQVNWSDQSSVAGGKWLQNMRSGEVPHMYSSSAAITGPFITSGFLEPASEYVDQFSQSLRSNLDFSLDRMSSVYGGFSKDYYEIPISHLPSNPFVIRADHAEQAGIDLEKDFPPENYEQLLQVGKQLQEEGPSKFGFQVHGSAGDVTDEITTVWATAEGGFDGNYVNEDWTDVNYDTDAWINAFDKQVKIYREHELSDQGTPTSSDERATQLMMSGDVSMSQINAQNFAIFLNQAPELVENGDIQFGEAWKGDAGYRGTGFIATFGLLTSPSDANTDDWETAQQGSMEFMESFLQPEWQTEWAKIFGHLPARDDVWEQAAEQMPNEEEVGFGEAILKNAQDIGPAWSAHPQLPFIKATVPGPEFQKALRGDISAEQACLNSADTVRQQTTLGE